MTALRDASALDRNRADGHAPLAVIQPPDWTLDAVCAQTDPSLFFPEKGGSTKPAKRICAGCPVNTECLEYAMEIGDRFGIYGGKSERERRQLARARAAA